MAVEFTDALVCQPAVEVTLLTQAGDGDSLIVSCNENVKRIIATSKSKVGLQMGIPFKSILREMDSLCSIPTVLHSHGVWLPLNHWACQGAHRAGIPLIIQPHGMLEPWAMNFKAYKKRLAMALFQRRDLQNAHALIATSLSECENIRNLGFRQPIAVIRNGVKFHDQEPTSQLRYKERDRRTVLFLSRVHPKKGLINLVRAWANLAPRGWCLKIAGPDESGHLQEVMALVKKLGLESSVEYVGEVDGERKSLLYRRADIFVLPTFTENFGVVVAEALAHGVPVITTRGAPWADLETFRCGWWVDIGVEPLVQALREAIGLNDDERQAMGQRGQEFIRRYDWDDIARQTVEVYRWVLGQGAKPDCVYVD